MGARALTRAGFARVATLPVATLHLPFKSEAEYLASLSAQMRKDLKKKMKGLATRRWRFATASTASRTRSSPCSRRPRPSARLTTPSSTRCRTPTSAKWSTNLRGRVTIILIRIGGQLASFSILLEEKNRIIGKYIGMRYPLAREHNVYFLNWMLVVRHCIEKRAEWLQVGQTTYRQKARLAAS
jgi:hypothetical protein